VYGTVDPKRLPKGSPIIRTQKELQPAIDRGLRAQLGIVSLVTGQLSVSLDFLPQTPVVPAELEPGLPELPTVPTRLEKYQARLERILVSLDKVDLAQLAQEISEMTRGSNGVARSPELASAIRTAGDAFHIAQELRATDGRLP